MMMNPFGAIRSACAGFRRTRRGTRVLAIALAVPVAVVFVLAAALAPALDASSRIPVAVVNLDEGARDDSGRQVRAGSDLVDSLSDSDELAWDIVDAEAADEGLSNGSYALILEIPEDYSQKVASLAGSDPERASLSIVSDGSGNVLATEEGSAVLRQVQARLRSEIGEGYLLNVFNDVRGQASALSLAADGSVMLDGAYGALEDGTSAIASGLEQAAVGSAALARGIDGVAAGATAAGAGSESLASGMSAAGSQLAAPLAAGARGVSDGVNAAGAGASALGTSVTQMGTALQGASDALDQSLSSLAGLQGLVPEITDHAVSLGQALQNMDGAADDLGVAADGLASSADRAVDSVAAASDAAASLARDLSSPADGSSDGGVLQQLDGLDQAYEELEEELRSLLTDRASGMAVGGTIAPEDAERILGDLAHLADLRASIREDVSRSAAGAADVSSKMDSAVTELEGMEGERQALSDSSQRYESAAGAAADEAAQVASLAGQASGPVSGVLGDAAIARETLRRTSPLVVAAGAGISRLGESLSATGPVGQGAKGVAEGAAALPQMLDGFSAAAAGIGRGNVALGQALSAVGAGASGLSDGVSAMAGAQYRMMEGVAQVRQGQQQITDALSSAGDDLGDLSSGFEDRAATAAAPVSISTTERNRVEGDGSIIAPIAVSIALWAGAAVAAVAAPAIDARAAIAGRLGASALPGLAVSCGIALAQALLASIAAAAAGVDSASPVAFMLLAVVGSLSFGFVAQAIRELCGRAAALALAVFLGVQVVCGGSILPASFVGGVFSLLGSVLPIPVLTEALRGAVSGSVAGAGPAAVVLAIWGAASVAVLLLAARARAHVRPERVFTT